MAHGHTHLTVRATPPAPAAARRPRAPPERTRMAEGPPTPAGRPGRVAEGASSGRCSATSQLRARVARQTHLLSLKFLEAENSHFSVRPRTLSTPPQPRKTGHEDGPAPRSPTRRSRETRATFSCTDDTKPQLGARPAHARQGARAPGATRPPRVRALSASALAGRRGPGGVRGFHGQNHGPAWKTTFEVLRPEPDLSLTFPASW